MQAFHTDCRTHRHPKNNSLDPAAFYTHTHAMPHTHYTKHTQEHTDTLKYTAEAVRNSCAQYELSQHHPEMSHVSQPPEALKPLFT